jgi:heme o synthase
VLFYTVILTAVTLLPFVTRMSGAIYLGAAIALDAVYLAYAFRIYFSYSDRIAQQAFRYSIVYLAALFAALLLDHYFRFPL